MTLTSWPGIMGRTRCASSTSWRAVGICAIAVAVNNRKAMKKDRLIRIPHLGEGRANAAPVVPSVLEPVVFRIGNAAPWSSSTNCPRTLGICKIRVFTGPTVRFKSVIIACFAAPPPVRTSSAGPRPKALRPYVGGTESPKPLAAQRSNFFPTLCFHTYRRMHLRFSISFFRLSQRLSVVRGQLSVARELHGTKSPKPLAAQRRTFSDPLFS